EMRIGPDANDDRMRRRPRNRFFVDEELLGHRNAAERQCRLQPRVLHLVGRAPLRQAGAQNTSTYDVRHVDLRSSPTAGGTDHPSSMSKLTPHNDLLHAPRRTLVLFGETRHRKLHKVRGRRAAIGPRAGVLADPPLWGPNWEPVEKTGSQAPHPRDRRSG